MSVDWDNLFKPEDFDMANVMSTDGYWIDIRKQVAKEANARLREILKDAPTVYLSGTLETWHEPRLTYDTHSAKLMMIKRIEK